MQFTKSLVAAALAAPAVLAAPQQWNGERYSVVAAPSGTAGGWGWWGKAKSKVMFEEAYVTVAKTVTLGAGDGNANGQAYVPHKPSAIPFEGVPSAVATAAAGKTTAAAVPTHAALSRSHSHHHYGGGRPTSKASSGYPVVVPSGTSSKPQPTFEQPEPSTTSIPEPSITSVPEPETTTSVPEPETTTSVDEPETTTPVPVYEPTTVSQQPEPTTTSVAEPTTTPVYEPTTTPSATPSSPPSSDSSSSAGLPSDGLKTGSGSSLSAQEFADISVYHHNIHRRNHSSPDVTWSDTLAANAKEAAAKCVMTHDLPASYGSVGSNLAGGSGGEPNPSDMPSMWYNGEFASFPGFELDKTKYADGFSNWGHLTQVLWPTTKEIGCATAVCSNGGWYGLCLYSPPGNINDDYGIIGAPQREATVLGNDEQSSGYTGQ